MIRGDGHVDEHARVFAEVFKDTNSLHDAIWAVVASDRQERRVAQRGELVNRLALSIVSVACARFGVALSDFMSSKGSGRHPSGKPPAVVQCRWVAMRAMRAQGFSLPTIGASTARHHTTVMYGLAQVAGDPQLVVAAREVAEAALREAVA